MPTDAKKQRNTKTQPPPQTFLWHPENRPTHIKREDNPENSGQPKTKKFNLRIKKKNLVLYMLFAFGAVGLLGNLYMGADSAVSWLSSVGTVLLLGFVTILAAFFLTKRWLRWTS